MSNTSQTSPNPRIAFLMGLVNKNARNIQESYAKGSDSSAVVPPAPVVASPGAPLAVPLTDKSSAPQPTSGARVSKRSRREIDGTSDAGTSATETFVGLGGVQLPVPDDSNPKCKKVRGVTRFVPHPPISFPKRTAAERFAAPLFYGACIADQEVAADLSASDTADLVSQKLGEVFHLTSLLREKALEEGKKGSSGEAAARLVVLRQEVAEAKAELEARAKGQAELENSLAAAQSALKVAQEESAEKAKIADGLRSEVDLLVQTVEELKGQLSRSEEQCQTLATQGHEAGLAMYHSSTVLACKKARDLYPGLDINWESLLDLTLEEMEFYSSKP